MIVAIAGVARIESALTGPWHPSANGAIGPGASGVHFGDGRVTPCRSARRRVWTLTGRLPGCTERAGGLAGSCRRSLTKW